jgi:isocitrate/isopropylmalate dehydrogenase
MTKTFRIAAIAGDGIGKEVLPEGDLIAGLVAG